MNKKKGIIIGVFSLVITMVVGYALFGKNIEIKGTATASGNFDLSYICNVEGNGGTGSYEIVDNKITTTSTLTKPTDSVTYTITITNNGTIPAVLKTIASSNNVSRDDFNVPGDSAYLDKATMLVAGYELCKLQADGNTCIGSYSDATSGDSAIAAQNITLQPGEKMLVSVMHAWGDSGDLGVEQPKLPDGGATMEYNVTLGFEQAQ